MPRVRCTESLALQNLVQRHSIADGEHDLWRAQPGITFSFGLIF